MTERFEGSDGKRKLIECLDGQSLVKGQRSDAIARRLADIVTVREFIAKEQLYVGGKAGNNALFLILGGSFDLSIHDRHVATLETGQFVGEFPILNASLDYTVSAFARERSVVASVPEEQLRSLASEYPEIWQNMAKDLALRLRNTNTAKQQPSRSEAINPEAITVGALSRSLTLAQLWKLTATIVGALGVVAAVAYKMGTIKLLG